MNWTQSDIDRIQRKSATPKPMQPVNEPPVYPETRIQQQLVKWFAWRFQAIYATGALFSVPNQGRRNRANASRMKAEGMVSSVSDLILLHPSGPYHGACLELKNSAGKVTPGQHEWLAHRKNAGYFTGVAYSFEEGVEFFENYMNQL